MLHLHISRIRDTTKQFATHNSWTIKQFMDEWPCKKVTVHRTFLQNEAMEWEFLTSCGKSFNRIDIWKEKLRSNCLLEEKTNVTNLGTLRILGCVLQKQKYPYFNLILFDIVTTSTSLSPFSMQTITEHFSCRALCQKSCTEFGKGSCVIQNLAGWLPSWKYYFVGNKLIEPFSI